MRRQLPIITLAAATVCSIGGTRLSAIAIPWLVLTATGSPVLTGLVGMAEMLPYVLAKAFGGPLIDRIGARRIAILCDILSALAVAIVPLLYWSGILSIWLLMPAVALIGVLRAPPDAAKQALVPDVAALVGAPLERTTGIMGASDRLAGILGAAGAGALIALVGAVPALLVNAVAFLLSALLLLVGLGGANKAEASSSKYLAQFAEGWAMLRGDPVLLGMTIMIAVTNLFDQAYATVLLPVWVKAGGLDVSWVGIFLATFSAGALGGATLAAIFGRSLPRLLIYTAGFICAGPLPMTALALSAPLPTLLAILLISGFAAGFINPIIGAILFERIPKPMVGRVIALVGALTWCLMPFGGIYAGLLVDSFGIAMAFAMTGLLYLVAALAPIAMPSFREMNRKRVAPA